MNELHTIPTEREINVYDSLDERCASKNFLGKSLAEAEALFRDNSLCYQEDLQWMGPVAFRFYIHAAVNYVQSERSTGDSSIVSCLAMILNERLQNEPQELLPVADLLSVFCRYVAEHCDRFDATPDIYGDLRGSYATLTDSFLHLNDNTRNA